MSLPLFIILLNIALVFAGIALYVLLVKIIILGIKALNIYISKNSDGNK